MSTKTASEGHAPRMITVTIGVVLVVAVLIPVLMAFAPPSQDDGGEGRRSAAVSNTFGASSVPAELVEASLTFTADSTGLHYGGQDYPASTVRLYAPEIPSGSWTLEPDGTGWLMGAAYVEGPYTKAIVTVTAGAISVESWEGSSHGTAPVATASILFITAPWVSDSGYATAAESPMTVPSGSSALLMSGESWNSTLAIATFSGGSLTQNLRTVDVTVSQGSDGPVLTVPSTVRAIGPVFSGSGSDGGGTDDPDDGGSDVRPSGGIVWSLLWLIPVLLLVGLVLMALPIPMRPRDGTEKR